MCYPDHVHVHIFKAIIIIMLLLRHCIALHYVPYLSVYNAHPYFGLHFEKEKKDAENRGSGYEKTA